MVNQKTSQQSSTNWKVVVGVFILSCGLSFYYLLPHVQEKRAPGTGPETVAAELLNPPEVFVPGES